MNDTVILVALGDEFSASRVNGLPVIYTGVGKVNAALAAAGALSGGARTIINYGSAGAVTAGLAGLIECGSAVQRDMDLRPLGTPLGDTYGDPGPHAETWGVGPVVGTGDSFAEGAPELACDLVDMDGLRHRQGLPFGWCQFHLSKIHFSRRRRGCSRRLGGE